MEPGGNESAEEKQKAEGNEEQVLRGGDETHPPLLRKKKSSYDLRDIFHHQEAEANQSNSPPLASKPSPLPPDVSKASESTHSKSQ